MKKVMILANSTKGLYGFRNELVLRLLEKYELIISAPDEVCRQELEEEGARFVLTPINRRGVNPVEDLSLVKNYKKLLKLEKPDLVLTYTIKPNVYGGYACKKLHIPYMETITGLGSAFEKEGLMKKLVIGLYKNGINKAECVFFQNGDNQEIFRNCGIHGKKEKRVMGSGVNLDIHRFEEYPNETQIKFLLMSRILKEKGIEEYLEAAKQLKSENIQFQILGGCEEDYEELINKYEKDGIVVSFGFQKDVNPYLRNCSALVLPSYYPEGVSNVLMEASATGRPILTTNMPGCRDVVEDSITGFRFEPKSSEALIEAMKKFIALTNEERAKMGKAARTKMEKEFDRNLVIDDYMEEIDRILDR